MVDELLVHVAELLVPGRTAVEAYLDAVAADVADYLRPRVRAAVLVEDRLVADDHAHLLVEAAERGLDPRRAAAVIAELAAELGAVVEPVPGSQTADGRRTDGGPGVPRMPGTAGQTVRVAGRADRSGRRTGGRGWPAGGRRAGGRSGWPGAEGRLGRRGRGGEDRVAATGG